MKKLALTITGLILVSVLSAQTLDDIVKRYAEANRLERIANLKTIKITGNMSMMGGELPMTMWMKNPDKIKTVTTFNGQEMIQVFDGVKGYTVNPMMGSITPREMTPEEIKQVLRANIFRNYLATYLRNGQLSLEGEEMVNDKGAFKLKATLEDGTVINFFIDKTSYLLVKLSSTLSQGGMKVNVNSYPSNYTETSGLMVPMTTTTKAEGMEIVMNFTSVEVDIPMDDSIFRLN